MKERSILFSAPMVNAILNGKKTQTRRIIKPQPYYICGHNNEEVWYKHIILNCPYGQAGDRLWIKETFCPVHPVKNGEADKTITNILYRATHLKDSAGYNGHWKPSIFMPKKVSRITLEITNIRVERIQEISEADIIAEGIKPFAPNGKTLESNIPSMEFQVLWDSINKKRGYGWMTNPWVWAILFRVIK